jgi:hypothetical protein
MDVKVPVGSDDAVTGANPGKKAWTAPRLTVHGTLPAVTLAQTGPVQKP